MERASIQDRLDKAQPVTAPMETQIATNARKLHKQAQAVEERWRTAHGFDTKLRGKHQIEAKRKWQRLQRREVRRRKERKRQRVERQMLARPLLKGVMVMTRERSDGFRHLWQGIRTAAGSPHPFVANVAAFVASCAKASGFSF